MRGPGIKKTWVLRILPESSSKHTMPIIRGRCLVSLHPKLWSTLVLGDSHAALAAQVTRTDIVAATLEDVPECLNREEDSNNGADNNITKPATNIGIYSSL